VRRLLVISNIVPSSPTPFFGVDTVIWGFK
jgi:hypothetical protein